MTPHDHTQQLREALRQNVRAFRHAETGEIKYLLTETDAEALWEDVMVIPNLQNETVDFVLAHANKPPESQHGEPDVLGGF